MVVDPRAGHGPGIGGFKADSEIGVAFKAGHPCYFIGFLPEPMPGQTIEDIAKAEAVFLERVIALHPDAEGKPCVIGNCQAGWAVMMLAALAPNCSGQSSLPARRFPTGPGSAASTRCATAAACSAAAGWRPSRAISATANSTVRGWCRISRTRTRPTRSGRKQYNLYSKIDTEAPRYLDFERWWGGHVNLNAEEIQFIVDELFVGNKLAAGEIRTSDGTTIDLRNIRSPIVVFCSKGDNVTPPQQALGWILDLYESVDDIRSHGQTIVYTIHETAGHLGIFVSGGVAKKEHSEFSSNIDLIDVLPPGLYEAVFEAKTEKTASPDLVTGDWVMRCEERTLDDIRALGGNDAEDERRFATAARVSDANLAAYRTFLQPFVRMLSSPAYAEWMRRTHPLRLQYELFSDANPAMGSGEAGRREAARRPETCRSRQSLPRAPGDDVQADRPRARRVAGHERDARRANVPVALRFARPSSRGRHRFRAVRSGAEGRQDGSSPPDPQPPDRRNQIAHRHRRPSRMRDTRAPLCRQGAGRG